MYKDLDGDSNVECYEIGDDYISIKFYNTNKIYKYTYRSASKYHVETMKQLAIRGENLNSYIIKRCSDKFER